MSTTPLVIRSTRVAWGVRRTHCLSGTLDQNPDVVVQLTVKVRPGPDCRHQERSAAQTIEPFVASIKTKIKSNQGSSGRVAPARWRSGKKSC
jgi:hypothetical protein